MFSLLEMFRAPIFRGSLPEPWLITVAAAWSVAALGLGWWTFTKRADEFAYRV